MMARSPRARAVHAFSLAISLALGFACEGGDGEEEGSGGTTTETGGTGATETTASTGGTGGTGSTTGGSGSTGIPEYSHAADIQPIWSAQCVNECHDSACATPGTCDPLTENTDVFLDGDAYDNLVSMMSVQHPAMVLVKPGDPENSYLWRKITGTHTEVCMPDCGDQMPKDADPLDATTQQMINDWIAGGALP